MGTADNLTNEQKLAMKVILEAIQDYYNYFNNKGNRFSRREGSKIKSWVESSDFNFWSEFFGVNPNRLKRLFEKCMAHIDKGGTYKDFIKGKVKAPSLEISRIISISSIQ